MGKHHDLLVSLNRHLYLMSCRESESSIYAEVAYIHPWTAEQVILPTNDGEWLVDIPKEAQHQCQEVVARNLTLKWVRR